MSTTFFDALVRRVLARLIAKNPIMKDEGNRTPPLMRANRAHSRNYTQGTRLEAYEFLLVVLVVRGIRYMWPAVLLARGDAWEWMVGTWNFLWHVGCFVQMLLLPVVVVEVMTVRMGGWRRMDEMLA